MKKIVSIIGVLSVIFVACSFFYKPISKITDVSNGTYVIEGQSVTMTDGVGSIDLGVDSTSAKSTVRYFGNEAMGDLNNDGVSDTAFLVTKTGAGTGTFYYLVAAIKTPDGYVGTDAVFLGDRIAPQTTEIRNGLVIINYADRTIGESFATAPSQGKSIWLKVDPKTFRFGEVIQDFEGETDFTRLGLSMQKYTSEKFGIEFFYPKNYFIETKELGTPLLGHTQVVLTDDTKENQDVREGRSPGREGPTAITFDFYQNFEKITPLAWVKGDTHSNFKLSEGVYQEIILARKPAVGYSWSGLYEVDVIVLTHREYVLAMSVTYRTSEDQIRRDFQGILKTLRFRQ